MKIVDLPIESLTEATWNANQADDATMARLQTCIIRYGMVLNMVVRPLGEWYEVLDGNQRLALLREMGTKTIPCVVVNLNDAQARLLSQALNHIHGEDDLGLRAELVREILKIIPEEEVLAILPETLNGLKGLASMGQEAIADYLQNRQRAHANRLLHMQFKLTVEQLATVKEAITQALSAVRKLQSDGPNMQGRALHLICKSFLERRNHDDN